MHTMYLPGAFTVQRREGNGSLGSRITRRCKLYGSWELNLCPLEEQQVILTTEPRLQSMIVSFGCRLSEEILLILAKCCAECVPEDISR